MEKKYPQEHRAERGGNYGLEARSCRSAYRYWGTPECRSWRRGIRPVAEVNEDRYYPVLRGGSWFNRARICRSAFRRGDDPGNRIADWGFRPVTEANRELLKKG